jgi:hypothetical protein
MWFISTENTAPAWSDSKEENCLLGLCKTMINVETQVFYHTLKLTLKTDAVTATVQIVIKYRVRTE